MLVISSFFGDFCSCAVAPGDLLAVIVCVVCNLNINKFNQNIAQFPPSCVSPEPFLGVSAESR